MTIKFYYMKASAPCRAVQLTAAALGLELELIETDLRKGEHLTPEFIKINPQHTIPTLVDEDGFSIWESRAIIFYLAEKYGKGKMIPSDIKGRATLIQRLHFDSLLYICFAEYYYPIFMKKQPADEEKLQKMEKNLDILNTFLGMNKYIAGEEYTIADCSLISIISTYEAAGQNFEKYPNITRWYNLMKEEAPAMDINAEGIEALKQFFADNK